jgi:hypothetical protein
MSAIGTKRVVDARRKFTLMAGAAIRLLVLLAVLAGVRGAGFDLAVHAGEW